MNAEVEINAWTGLRFFGKITASGSHEIKNLLAIINENAGLLEDLALMADRGTAIQPQRLKDMSRALMKQVGRADVIVKNISRLAHSVDESIKTTDLNDLLELLVGLSHRPASTRGVAIQVNLHQGPLKVRTSPFFLMNLLWCCLDFATIAAGDDKNVEVVTRKTEGGIRIFFKGLGDLKEAPAKPFPAETEKGLCGLLGATLEVNTAGREIVVGITESIGR